MAYPKLPGQAASEVRKKESAATRRPTGTSTRTGEWMKGTYVLLLWRPVVRKTKYMYYIMFYYINDLI
jgi:hypothetical protein